ncbi:protein translocase subunit SecDF [Flavimarina sp. Hel_I_48]|uniref:protein translocase subunit SecDF n=1 Tax=Flavimarina sp. Hel_I_48 TaxID=1392488 RepID=UPI0004DF7A64|nr:protein translocase subunit SecDF [Flavimarina sp. Hel_I_48]
MQNKGLIKVFAILFGLVSLYQLSFTYFTNSVEDKAEVFAESKVPASTDDYVERRGEVKKIYLDSIGNDPIAVGITYNDAKEKELNKGLDLKGGMNAILEISVADILRGLSNNSQDPAFNQALSEAAEAQKTSQQDFLEDFNEAYQNIPGDNSLASPDLFANTTLGEKVNFNMSNDEVIDVLRTEVDESINSAFEVLRNRIDKFGVTQPNIQRLDNRSRILIELPGATDIERVKFQLESTAQLEFYKTYFAGDVAEYLFNANNTLKELIAPADDAAVAQDTTESDEDDAINDLLASEEDTTSAAAGNNPLFEIFQFNPYIQQNPQTAVLGYAAVQDTATINRYLSKPEIIRERPQNLRFAKFRWGVTESEDSNIVPLYALQSDRAGTAAMDGDIVQDSRQQYTQTGLPSVGIDFEGQGPSQWAKITREVAQQGNAIAIVLDDVVYSAATAKQEIPNGATEISGNFTVNKAQDLANVLKAGKLPASAKIISYDVVGPSLGQEAINSGLTSFLLALLLVLAWMIFYYGKAGWYADIALAVNILFIFGILAGLGAVLTLPGIAGIVLTIGMSVDANVLIFERIKEEMAKGKSQRDAIKDGFNNALSSILDANITTFLTALILFLFGTGPIQGFATTLMIGIATSLFTAIFITRLFIDSYGKNGKVLAFSTPATRTLFQNTNVDFLSKRKIAYTFSGVLILISIISFFTNGLDQGVDFVGGRNYTVRFDHPVNASDAESNLTAEFGSAQAKTYGDANQLKITTKYKIEDEGTEIDNEIQQKLFTALKSYLPASITYDQFIKGSNDEKIGILGYNKVGPTIANDIKRDSLWAVIGSLIVVFLYILLRFRRWQFSLGAVVAVFHDVIIVLGIFSLTYKFLPFNMEIDQSFIAAILTVIGYSLNDTVVVFDRIREYLNEHDATRKMGTIINQAINSTISRTLNTSMTTLIVLLAIFIFGGASIMGFMFALIVGVVVGTYSSIFIATPVMFDTVEKKALKHKIEREEEEVAH